MMRLYFLIFLLFITVIETYSSDDIHVDFRKEYLNLAGPEAAENWKIIETINDESKSTNEIINLLKESIEILKKTPPGPEQVTIAAKHLIHHCINYGVENDTIHALCTGTENYQALDEMSGNHIGTNGIYDVYMDAYHFLMPVLKKIPTDNKTKREKISDLNRNPQPHKNPEESISPDSSIPASEIQKN